MPEFSPLIGRVGEKVHLMSRKMGLDVAGDLQHGGTIRIFRQGEFDTLATISVVRDPTHPHVLRIIFPAPAARETPMHVSVHDLENDADAKSLVAAFEELFQRIDPRS